MSNNQPTQKEFLESAMSQLGMTRMDFANRIATPIRTLSKWLTDPDKKDYRNMPSMAWRFINEILEREAPNKTNKN